MTNTKSNAVAVGIGVGLLAWLGGAGIALGAHATGYRDGFEQWTYRVQSDPFYNDAGFGWGAAVAFWMLCAAAIRAGALGGLGAALSVLGSGVAAVELVAVISSHPVNVPPVVLGLAVWAAGTWIMVAARSRSSAKA